MSELLEVTVPLESAGERFDRFVARAAGISRQQAMELLDRGAVRVGRRRPKKGERVEAGAVLTIEKPGSAVPVPQPELPLTVLFEDPHLLALDKPAGISMHPLSPGERDTLANAVLARFPDVLGASDEERCPGLLHRLDRETSGVVLWARTREAFEHLRGQFDRRTVRKRYLALVEGEVEGEGEIVLPLAHDPASRRRMLATPYPADAEKLHAREAITRYRAISRGPSATLLEVEIPTGVRHQIRAHCAFAGHPVIGDALYGAAPVYDFPRHWLHAASIRFEHPLDASMVTVDSPLAPELLDVLRTEGIEPPAL